jgi:hypothetical protein
MSNGRALLAGCASEVSKVNEAVLQNEGDLRVAARATGQKPRKINVFKGKIGGEWGIRTPEGLHPTRFPSVRHRPLGEFS